MIAGFETIMQLVRARVSENVRAVSNADLQHNRLGNLSLKAD